MSHDHAAEGTRVRKEATRLGLEPRMEEPKSSVLPLHHRVERRKANHGKAFQPQVLGKLATKVKPWCAGGAICFRSGHTDHRPRPAPSQPDVAALALLTATVFSDRCSRQKRNGANKLASRPGIAVRGRPQAGAGVNPHLTPPRHSRRGSPPRRKAAPIRSPDRRPPAARGPAGRS
jgi:hypothetical protein